MAALQQSQPAAPIPPMSEEFVSAFHDLQNDATNYVKLVWFFLSYYVNNLNAPEFVSANIRPRLNNLIRGQPVNDLPSIFQKFYHNISRLHDEHLMMEMKLKSMNESFRKQLHSIAVFKKVYPVLFNAAAMICVAVAAIAAANVIPMSGWARAWIRAVAAAAPILFAALGDWRQSILMKRETALNKHKDIIIRMLMVARPIMTDLGSVYYAARGLEFEIKSLSEAVDDGEKLAAVENYFQELLRYDEKYNTIMNWANDSVLGSVAELLGQGT